MIFALLPYEITRLRKCFIPVIRGAGIADVVKTYKCSLQERLVRDNIRYGSSEIYLLIVNILALSLFAS